MGTHFTRYAECKGFGLDRACPFKCHHSIIHDVPYEDEVDAGVRPASRSDGTFIEEMDASMAASTALE